MPKVTSKLQVTIPKVIADRYRIHPGDEITWQEAGEVIRVLPPNVRDEPLDVEARLRLFDEATSRQQRRQRKQKASKATKRGWTREDLYGRARAR